jgi:hypothetical protein
MLASGMLANSCLRNYAIMKSQQKWLFGLVLAGSLAAALPVLAQDPGPANPPPSGGWRRFDAGNPPPANTDAPPPAGDPNQAPPPGQFRQRYQGPPVSNAPVKLTLPPGTWITVRVNEPISSDHSQKGDMFTATLARPVVADGHVIAHTGQMLTGVVSEAQKAGRVKGVSRLGLELTEMAIADGRQVQLKTTLMERRGDTSVGRDAAAIGTTTAAGAAIGAAVNGGVGAGVGAGAGLVVSTIGVLLTRGRPTIVYPEQPLTFRLETPLTVEGSESAFRPSSEEDYQRRPGPGPALRYGGAPAPYPPPYGYAYAYPGPYYGGYFGPYYGYGFGPGFYFRYGRGFGRRW